MRLTSLLLVLGFFTHPSLKALPIQKLRFQNQKLAIVADVIDDNLVHIEVATRSAASGNQPIARSLYIDSESLDRNYQGPSQFTASDHLSFATAHLRVKVNPENLCLTFHDLVSKRTLTTICPTQITSQTKQLTLSQGLMTDIYGLGEEFLKHRAGEAHINWRGEQRQPGNKYGNAMPEFNGGATGNAHFPILYAVGPQRLNYALFVDDVYAHDWDFRTDPWRLKASGGDQLRFFFIRGDDLPKLRQQYMNLVGKPLVPPKKAFGLWISEYGFDSWAELEGKLRTLREHHFPLDGFVLDLQWFGGVLSGSEKSPMGKLLFDESYFPNHREQIAKLEREFGVGLMTIEESYVSRGLAEHSELEARGFLAREDLANNKAFFINENTWWGAGGMIDWTHPEARRYWHNEKRQPLVDAGVIGHWTDLGEPEMYRNIKDLNQTPLYFGFPELRKNGQADIHNVFSLLWHKGIADGYVENGVERRPWILSRSGSPGSQRYGAALWSGDIGSNFGSLATQLGVHAQMSMSGGDYFGSDIGGFHRKAIDREPKTKIDDLYTQWFADSALLDVPVRPHTMNLGNNFETAPDRVGHLKSNLFNIRLRYELSPYYYSLAHRAYRFGEPVAPPLVFYYQDAVGDRADFNVRNLGDERMLGRDLLIATTARPEERARDVYLPPGDWFNYHSGDFFAGIDGKARAGRTLLRVNLYPEQDGVLKLPLYARSGAIVPRMFVDEKTMNIVGKRSDGNLRGALFVRVFQGGTGLKSEFTLFEDDGWSTDYQKGLVAETHMTQEVTSRELVFRIDATKGRYKGAPTTRGALVEYILKPGVEIQAVFFNDQPLRRFAKWEEYLAADEVDEGFFFEPSTRRVFTRTRTSQGIFRYLL